MKPRSLFLALAVAVQSLVAACEDGSAQTQGASTSARWSTEQLMSAALTGDAETLHRYLESGGDPDLRDDRLVSLLHCASVGGHTELVRLLVESGADINSYDYYTHESAMHAAAGSMNDLLAAQASPVEDRSTVVDFLIEQGLNVNVEAIDGETPMYNAAFRHEPQMIRHLLARGGSLHHVDSSESALHAAVRWPDSTSLADTIDVILEAGIPIDVVDSEGRTALLFSVIEAKRKTIRAEAIRILVSRGADVNLADNLGNTPLIKATQFEQIDVVKRLLEHGADRNVRGYLGKTPLEIAEERGYDELVLLLGDPE